MPLKQLMNYMAMINSEEQFGKYALKVLADVILLALLWRTGRKALAVRTAATSSLSVLFKSGSLWPQGISQTLCNGQYITKSYKDKSDKMQQKSNKMPTRFGCKGTSNKKQQATKK